MPGASHYAIFEPKIGYSTRIWLKYNADTPGRSFKSKRKQ